MEEIKKALQDLSKAIENCNNVVRVSVTITFVKPKSNKAK